MKTILLIGNGGREHTIADAIHRSPQETEIINFATAVNPGIRKLAKEVVVGDIMDMKQIQEVAQKFLPNFAIVGPDDPIGAGAADALLEVGIPTFAPRKKGARIESSKSFTRELLQKYNIDASPAFHVSTAVDDTGRKEFFDEWEGQIVVKADGLMGGKGVLVAEDHFSTFEEADDFARKAVEKFGRVVLEEKLVGEEFSLISIVDGHTALDTPAIQDHKRAFDGDTGPNTGGMGCISDENNSLPFLTPEDVAAAHEITVKVLKALYLENDMPYVGVLYGGFIVTKNGVKLIEYNARFGDPEALNILPILESDFVKVCELAIAGELEKLGGLKFRKAATVVKYLCPEGYPTEPVKNVPVQVSSEMKETGDQRVFYASVAEEDGQLVLKGSRAIGITGIGENLEQARKRCEEMIGYFEGPLFYRKDIGTQGLINQRIEHMQTIRGE